jgi:sulfatase maturation enzyme AslB (radical SAM superfamily)
MSDTYCTLPWASMMLNTEGKVQVCCISGKVGDTKKNSLTEIWNSDELKQLRKDMLSGVRNNICSRCYDQEDQNIRSSRKTWNYLFNEVTTDIVPETKTDGSLDRFELKYMDLRFSNLCNFKCRTCFPVYSSKIAAEKKIPEVLKINANDIITQFKHHYPYLKMIYFAGGEPMLLKEHWEMLKDLIELDRAKDIDLLYTTNGSTLTFKDHDIIDYWPKFKSVNVQFSIDAMGKQAEYWRDGTVWEEIVENIKRVKTCPPTVAFKPHGTVGWPNIHSWIAFIKYAVDNKFCVGNDINAWTLTGPIEFSLQSAPLFKKEEIKIEIENLIDYLRKAGNSVDLINILNSMLTFMFAANTERILPILKLRINKTDDIRKKYFLDYFPEHQNMSSYF